MTYLNTIIYYDKKEIEVNLKEIFLNNRYNFTLKDSTINNIIKKWKSNTNKFKKYNALENTKDKDGNIILWKHENLIIYTSENSKPIQSEYFIWSSDDMIARARESHHYFIDATWHIPKGFNQLLIVLFKDIIIKEKLPVFYILMSNRKEELYKKIFDSILDILTQNYIYDLQLISITSDTENALINAIKAIFTGVQRIGCLYHFKANLIKEAKYLGLWKKKDKKIYNEAQNIINKLGELCFKYNGNMEIFEKEIKYIINNYDFKFRGLIDYFLINKKKYFIEENYNYNLVTLDVLSNSSIERYNRVIKSYLGNKKECNWIIFMDFINKEIYRIQNLLKNNQNKNIKFISKTTKFGALKYNERNSDNNKGIFLNNSNNIFNNKKNINIKLAYKLKTEYNITEKLLEFNNNNCRYTTFITIYYFIFSDFIDNLKGIEYKDLNMLNRLILDLVEDVKPENYNKIVEFLQNNGYDTNNELIDKCLYENNDLKKIKLLNDIKTNTKVDFKSKGSICQLFKLFNNKKEFCIIENKKDYCLLCNKTYEKVVTPYYHFFIIDEEMVKKGSILNILVDKYKEILNSECICKNNKDNLLTTKTKYNIISFPNYLFIFFDIEFNTLINIKNEIVKICVNELILGFDITYKLVGVIETPTCDHFICVIINPEGKFINKRFKCYLNYLHDNLKEKGKIIEISNNEDIYKFGYPHILIYKKI